MNPELVIQFLNWAWKASSPSVKRWAIRLGGMAAAAAIRETADTAHDKITKWEDDGQVSPRVASTMRGTTRAVSVAGEVTVAAVGGKSGGAVYNGAPVADAMRDAVRNPATTAHAYITSTANGLSGAEGTSSYDRFSAHQTVRGLDERIRYLTRGPES